MAKRRPKYLSTYFCSLPKNTQSTSSSSLAWAERLGLTLKVNNHPIGDNPPNPAILLLTEFDPKPTYKNASDNYGQNSLI
jgi:hypothetical protein